MTLSELKKEDYLSLKWHFLLLALCLLTIAGAFWYVGTLDTAATRQLNIARGDLNSAQATLDQIEQEEATIASTIGPYRDLADKGITAPPDRLEMQERFARIRADFALFPIQLNIRQQSSFTLPYAAGIAQPGQPVNLLINRMDTVLPLLHENDLANYLDALLAAPALVLPTSCSISATTRDARNYLRLGQHQQASCTFLWYNFQVMGKDGVPL